MILVTNAFSLQMLPAGTARGLLTVEQVSADDAAALLASQKWMSAIGHADLAAVVSADLGVDVDASRVSVTLDHATQLLVAQYRGPRLPEGTTQLPAGASIEYWRVSAMLARQ